MSDMSTPPKRREKREIGQAYQYQANLDFDLEPYDSGGQGRTETLETVDNHTMESISLGNSQISTGAGRKAKKNKKGQRDGIKRKARTKNEHLGMESSCCAGPNDKCNVF